MPMIRRRIRLFELIAVLIIGFAVFFVGQYLWILFFWLPNVVEHTSRNAVEMHDRYHDDD